jgi:preprotein translocase subunit SecG
MGLCKMGSDLAVVPFVEPGSWCPPCKKVDFLPDIGLTQGAVPQLAGMPPTCLKRPCIRGDISYIFTSMSIIVVVIHVLVCLALICIVLLQHGKGAGIGATFGGTSQTVFGSTGAAPFLAKLTAVAAILFMLTSLGLTFLTRQKEVSVMEGASKPPAAEKAIPKAPIPPAPAPPGQK